jgi:hypothetical protein
LSAKRSFAKVTVLSRLSPNNEVDVPYWSISCLWCNGYIADALLECIPALNRAHPGYLLLVLARPGAALSCPYCNGLIGFDDKGQPQPPQSGWPVFRYGRAELEWKKEQDGEPTTPHCRIGPCVVVSFSPAAIRLWRTTPMQNMHPLMNLSPEEMNFLRHWMYDEMHYQEASGPAKQLQRAHDAVPANLAVIIAAAIPDLSEQWTIGVGPPPAEAPTWPWSKAAFEARMVEAGALLESQGRRRTSVEELKRPATKESDKADIVNTQAEEFHAPERQRESR